MKGKKLLSFVGISFLVLSAGVMFSMGVSYAAAEKPITITWRLNTVFMPVGYIGEGVTWFCDQVKARSNGRLVINPYFGASLGFKATEALSVSKKGLVEINDIMLAPVAGEEPLASFNELAFLFAGDYEKSWKFADTVFWPEWKKLADKKWSSIAIGPYMLGDLDIYSKKPIQSFADLKGMKIRTGSTGPTADGLTAIGAEPFLISTSELYTALQRGMIDACITTEVSAVETKLWEVLKYDIRAKMGFIVCCLLINKKAFEDLPKDLQGVLLEMDKSYKEHMLAKRSKMVVEFRKKLIDNGIVEVTLSPDLLSQMRERSKPFWEKYADKTGPLAKELLEKAKKF